MKFDGAGHAFDVPIPDPLVAAAGEANAEMRCLVMVTRNHLPFRMHRFAKQEVLSVPGESDAPQEFPGR
jgi:hypothetical protein